MRHLFTFAAQRTNPPAQVQILGEPAFFRREAGELFSSFVLKLPLPLGEGWGEGLSAPIFRLFVVARTTPVQRRDFALSFAPSPPAPLPMGEGSYELESLRLPGEIKPAP
jgi:hypothetical protein